MGGNWPISYLYMKLKYVNLRQQHRVLSQALPKYSQVLQEPSTSSVFAFLHRSNCLPLVSYCMNCTSQQNLERDEFLIFHLLLLLKASSELFLDSLLDLQAVSTRQMDVSMIQYECLVRLRNVEIFRIWADVVGPTTEVTATNFDGVTQEASDRLHDHLVECCVCPGCLLNSVIIHEIVPALQILD